MGVPSLIVTCAVLLVTCGGPASAGKASSSSKCEKSLTTASGSRAPSGPYCPGDLIFEDTFDSFDLDTWQHENTLAGNTNWEFQWFTNNRSNSFVKEGNLFVRPTLTVEEFGEPFLRSGILNIHGGSPAEQCTKASFHGCERTGSHVHILNPVKSASLRTVDTFAFRYGKVEISAKLPVGDWLWPAITFLPKVNAYGSWPASGEIDLVESRGNLDYRVNGVHIGVEQVGSTLHFGPNPSQNGYDTTVSYKNSATGQGFNTGFHLYQLEWTPDHITFSVDNQVLRRIDAGTGFWNRGGFVTTSPASENPWMHASVMAPFDQEFYIIMNLAVGGTNGFFPDVPPATNGNRGKPWANNSPAAARDFWNGRNIWQPTWQMNVNRGKESSLQVDYVRVWAL